MTTAVNNYSYNTNAYSAVNQNSTSKSSSNNALDSSNFMKILLAQLQNQNPLDPVEDKDFMAQMAQLNSLQELTSINTYLKEMGSANKGSYATSLIGKKVSALVDKKEITGIVTGVEINSSEPKIYIGSKAVPLSSIYEVKAVS